MSRHSARGPAWEQLRRQVMREETHCHLCGAPVDTTLAGTHPLGPQLDHVTPTSKGGNKLDRANVRLCHTRCNQRRAAKMPKKAQKQTEQW